jgi:hypothetical protein
MVKRSKFLNENNSCSGRIENEIKQNLNKNNFSVDDLKQVSNLSNYTLRYLSNNEIFDINADKKLSKIFFLCCLQSSFFRKRKVLKTLKVTYNFVSALSEFFSTF